MEILLTRIEHLSTTSYPDLPCCVVHTSGCPLECFYCAEEGAGRAMDVLEVVEQLQSGRDLVDAVTIAGCEPLEQEATLELAAMLKESGFSVKLHTTGYYPRALERAVNEGVADLVELEIKAPLDTEIYERVTGKTDAADRVFESLSVLSSSQVPCILTATLAEPVFSEEDIASLLHALSCYGFRKLRVRGSRWEWALEAVESRLVGREVVG